MRLNTSCRARSRNYAMQKECDMHDDESARSFIIRPMEHKDLDAAASLSAKIGWPHRKEDWGFFFSIGEGLVISVDDQVQGTIMAFRHGEKLATVGMVIVDSAQQGRGLGRRLMEQMMKNLAGSGILLQATPSGAPLYDRLGFSIIGELNQHQGLAPLISPRELGRGESIHEITAQSDVPARLYSRASGADRQGLTRALLSIAKCAVLSRDGIPAGFAMLRKFGLGWCIGPVVASDRNAAQTLIRYWLSANTGNFTRIDLTGNEELSLWLEEIGLPRKDTPTTMRHGNASDSDPAMHLFAVSSHALG